MWTTVTACWPGLQTTWPTGYNACWMQQHLFHVLTSLTGVCDLCCTVICTGLYSTLLTVHRCLQEKAPRYLVDCTPVSGGLSTTMLSYSTLPYCAVLSAEHVQTRNAYRYIIEAQSLMTLWMWSQTESLLDSVKPKYFDTAHSINYSDDWRRAELTFLVLVHEQFLQWFGSAECEVVICCPRFYVEQLSCSGVYILGRNNDVTCRLVNSPIIIYLYTKPKPNTNPNHIELNMFNSVLYHKSHS